MDIREQMRRAEAGNRILGYILLSVPVLLVASCAAAVWAPDHVGILMLLSVAASCALAVWAEYLRTPPRDEDVLMWYWATQLPVVQVLLLVPSLVSACWSW